MRQDSFFHADCLEHLLGRASTDALSAPAPQGEQLARILSAGLRAPDHGKLRPWRYVVISGEARLAFAHKITEAVERQEPHLPEVKKEKRFRLFSTMPAIIALGMHLQPEHKVPLWEQKMAVGAGAMNVLNALHLAGFGGVWISGSFCEDRPLLEALGLPEPHLLAGFMFAGTPTGERKIPRRPVIEDYIALWAEGTPVRFGADCVKGRSL